MVDNIIVATLSNVNAAHDAARAIRHLTDAGGTKFKLKSGVIVAKDDRGSVSVLEFDVHRFHGTKVGVVVGGLIGLIGGIPLATLAALLGATVGLINDAGMAILVCHRDFDQVRDETRNDPNAVDDIVAQGGGRVFREAKGEY